VILLASRCLVGLAAASFEPICCNFVKSCGFFPVAVANPFTM
jgi:hypothetical protein